MSLSLGSDRQQLPELRQNIEILDSLPFFQEFPPKVVKLLAYLCERGDYGEGETIFEKGDDWARAMYILSGSATLYRATQTDMEKLRTYGAGDFLGGLSLLGPLPSLFSLETNTRTKVLTLSREQFSTVLEQFPGLACKLHKIMLQQLRIWEQTNVDELDSCCLSKVGVTLL